MWRSRSAAAVVAVATIIGALMSGAAAAEPTVHGKPVKFRVLDLRFRVLALDNSVSEESTGQRETLTLAADVFFAFDQDGLTIPAAAALADLAPRIAARAKGTVRIDAYTDAKGPADYNLDLSRRRAATVQADLERRLAGKPIAFAAVGHGAAAFVAPNSKADGSDDPEGRARNRRVTIAFDK
jgi:OmpA-OmpF porin, OOP family